LEQLEHLNKGAELQQITQDLEKRFMYIVKRLKAAYDICSGLQIRLEMKPFFLAVRSIVSTLQKV
jgi:type I restriction enzyme R subunit